MIISVLNGKRARESESFWRENASTGVVIKKKKAALSSLYQFMINITRLIKVKKEKNNTYILLTLELNVDILGGVHRARIPIYVVRCVENARPLSITGFHDLKKR